MSNKYKLYENYNNKPFFFDPLTFSGPSYYIIPK